MNNIDKTVSKHVMKSHLYSPRLNFNVLALIGAILFGFTEDSQAIKFYAHVASGRIGVTLSKGTTQMVSFSGSGSILDYEQVVSLDCGTVYTITASNNTIGTTVGFRDTPDGYLWEIRPQGQAPYDYKTSFLTTSTTQSWTAILKPKRVHFSMEPVTADGRTRTQASLTFFSGTSSNYFKQNPVWTIVGDSLGCAIDSSSGWIQVGTENGEVTVKATDPQTSKVVMGTLRIGCQSCNINGADNLCGIGQGIVGNARNALSISMGVFTYDNSFLGSIRLKLTDSTMSFTRAGLLYDQTNTDNAIPYCTNDSGGLRQIMAPQCLADIVTISAGYQINLYRPADAGTLSSGLFQPTGTPFKVWQVTSTTSGHFTITEDPAGANTQSTFSWSSANNSWVLNRANAEQEVKIVTSQTPLTGEDARRTETVETSSPGDSSISSRSTKTYVTLNYGGNPVPDLLVESRIDGRNATGGIANPDIVTKYSYTSSKTTNGHPMLQRMTQSDGYWEHYTYSGDLVSSVYAPWQNSVAPTNVTSVPTSIAYQKTLYDYTLLTGDSGTDLTTPRKTEVYIQDSASGTPQLVSRRYVLLSIDSNATPRLNVRTDIICKSSTANWNDSGNLVTVTKTYCDGAYKNSLRSIDLPDGTRTVYTYGVTNSTYTTTEVLVGAANATNAAMVTDGTLTRTTLTDRGYTLKTEQYDIVSGKQLVSDVWSVPGTSDLQGRFTLLTHKDGTTETFTYDCCSLTQHVDRDGATTTYTPDSLKRPWLTSIYGILTQNKYDASGNVTNVTRNGTHVISTLPARFYDRAGRIISETNALLGGTTIVETTNAQGARVITTTYPDLGTKVQEYYCDGRVAKISGSAVSPIQYDYGFDSSLGQQYVKETKLDSNGAVTTEWTKTYFDFVGRQYKTVYSDATGTPYSQKFFNDQGQVWKEIDQDGVVTAYIYNTKGEVEYTMVGLESEPTTPLTSPDVTGNHPIKREQTLVGSFVDGGVTYDTMIFRTTEWTNANASDSIVTSESHTSLDGLRQWTVLYPNDSCKQVTRTVTQFANNTKTVTTTFPDLSSEVNISTNGRLSTTGRYSSTGGQLSLLTYGYDGDGHVYSINDARNGATTFTYNNADLTQTVTTPIPATGGASQTTTNFYDSMLRFNGTVLPDLTTVTNFYYPNGLLKQAYGSRIYPVQFAYTAQGRMSNMTTWQNFTNNSGMATTTWNYDANHGWLNAKLYNDNNGPSYLHYPSGKIKARTWVRQIGTTNLYNVAGGLSAVNYSDGSTITNVYDRRGRLKTVIENGTNTTSFSLNTAGQVIYETHTGGVSDGVVITNIFDPLLRRTNISTLAGNTSYSYDEASRLKVLSNNGTTATYSYIQNSKRIDNIIFAQNGVTRLTVSNQYDYLDRLTNVLAFTNNTGIYTALYQYNQSNQRTNVTLIDNSYWQYQYDSLGQLKSSKKYWSNGTSVAGQQFEYTFDTIGNRIVSREGGNASGANLRQVSYTPNLLNQQTQRTVPSAIDVIGNANQGATVTVNSQRPYRIGNYFRYELPIENASSPVYQGVTNFAIVNNGTNADIVATNIGNTFLAKTPETFIYDGDGNMTSDGRWSYVWNAENRLTEIVALSTTPAAARYKIDFVNDYMGRRLQKIVATNNAGNYVVASTNRFIYDGWNLVAITDGTNKPLMSFSWGTDLSGTPQGAGGVGGLISVTVLTGSNVGTYFYLFDGNGNVVGLIRATDGTFAARYEYDSFGNVLRASGPMAYINPFLFSTKYYDWETGLYYFNMRYYKPSLGRWLSRDPIEESGGLNQYGFVNNNPVSRYDLLGLAGYFFDGTNNDGDRDREDDPNQENGPTNVKILFDIYSKEKRYMWGVGTREPSRWRTNLGLSAGLGMDVRISDMVNYFKERVSQGDCKMDVFGFSRGAASAREFVNRIRDFNPDAKVRFLGIFDTVLSVPNSSDYRMKIPNTVVTVVHPTASAERRYYFPLSSIKAGATSPITQPDWFEFSMPGAHSDVGGGYKDNRQFANVTLQIMHDQAVLRGVPFGPIPTRYSDVKTQGLEPHDSRWTNDKVGDFWSRINREPLRAREVIYYP